MTETAIGVVGAGSVARLMHIPVLLSMPGVRIAWVTDANPGTAGDLCESYRLKHAPLPQSPADLPPCDIVLLATPVGVREPYYAAMAARGTAVFAEKPFAINSVDHDRLVRLFPEHRVACGYMRRAYRTTVLFKKIIAEQWFGPLKRIVVTEGDRIVRTGVDRSHYDDIGAAGGGVLMTQGTHSLDVALYITAATDFRVRRSEIVMDGPIDRRVDATVDLIGKNIASDCSLDFRVSWIDRQDNAMELHFERAVVSASNSPDSIPTVRGCAGSNAVATLAAPGLRAAKSYDQAFYLEWEDFIQGVREGRPSIISAESALRTTALVEALYRHAGSRP